MVPAKHKQTGTHPLCPFLRRHIANMIGLVRPLYCCRDPIIAETFCLKYVNTKFEGLAAAAA